MQQELVRMVAEKTGISEDKARTAAETVIGYLKNKMPAAVSVSWTAPRPAPAAWARRLKAWQQVRHRRIIGSPARGPAAGPRGPFVQLR